MGQTTIHASLHFSLSAADLALNGAIGAQCQTHKLLVFTPKKLYAMSESVFARRWRGSSQAPDPLGSLDDPDHMAVLRAKAITAALMYGDDSDVGSEDTRTAFVPNVQDHVEATGEFGIAQDIDDAVELGHSVRKV